MDLNKLTNEEYNAYVSAKAKPSPMGKNMVWAFLVGGLICVIGQGLMDFYKSRGLGVEAAFELHEHRQRSPQQGKERGGCPVQRKAQARAVFPQRWHAVPYLQDPQDPHGSCAGRIEAKAHSQAAVALQGHVRVQCPAAPQAEQARHAIGVV